MKLNEKFRVLEGRKRLVESMLFEMNGVVNECVLNEKKLFNPMSAFGGDEAEADQDKLAGDYWNDLNKKSDNKGFLGNMARKMKGFADKASGKMVGAADKTDSAARSVGRAAANAGDTVSNAGKDIRRGMGFVKPGEDVDDPRYATQLVKKSVAQVKKSGAEFKAKALNTTKDINKFQTGVSDMLNKFNKLSDSLPGNFRGKAEREVMGVVKSFYDALNDEKGRIDSFMQTMKSDMSNAGYANQPMNEIDELASELEEVFAGRGGLEQQYDDLQDYQDEFDDDVQAMLAAGKEMLVKVGIRGQGMSRFEQEALQLANEHRGSANTKEAANAIHALIKRMVPELGANVMGNPIMDAYRQNQDRRY